MTKLSKNTCRLSWLRSGGIRIGKTWTILTHLRRHVNRCKQFDNDSVCLKTFAVSAFTPLQLLQHFFSKYAYVWWHVHTFMTDWYWKANDMSKSYWATEIFIFVLLLYCLEDWEIPCGSLFVFVGSLPPLMGVPWEVPGRRVGVFGHPRVLLGRSLGELANTW